MFWGFGEAILKYADKICFVMTYIFFLKRYSFLLLLKDLTIQNILISKILTMMRMFKNQFSRLV